MLGTANGIISDTRPQLISEQFQQAMIKWDINHIASNGKAERAIQTVKGLMNKNVIIDIVLWACRDIPLANGYSPAQLLFGGSLDSLGILTESQINVGQFCNVGGAQRMPQVN